ncbi:hypothetical protein LP416_15350 [Polaromonas sp. P2-4]|nr:hypothetical protein LP416_15350 [Polaromonas sp. P2-4]
MKTLALSSLFLATLSACGGGGGGAPASTAASGAALNLATSFLAAYDASLAASIPATGAAALALTDGCVLNNGFSKTLAIAEYDADTLRVASRQFEIGSTRTGISVLADRLLTNADGTGRREIDVQYAINYADGTKDEKATQTLISGSSSGSTIANGSVCATPEDKADLRFFGNREVVNTFITASNEREGRNVLATGAAGALVYNKYISLGVRDPANVATYATISGPGLTVAGRCSNLQTRFPTAVARRPGLCWKKRQLCGLERHR